MKMQKMNGLKVITLVLLGVTLAGAQASRTWVSGVGDDANPCSRTAPCKTWAGAISKTAPGGEIDALDPGGFGALTITKSITLDGGGGQVASTLVSGTNGFVVTCQGCVVIIRNIRINGIGTGINGITWLAGAALHIENCFIFGFTNNGINITKSDGGQAWIEGTTVENNSQSGLLVQNTTTTTSVSVDRSHFDFNLFGVLARDFSKVTVSNSTASGNNSVGFISSILTGGTGVLNVSSSTSANNAGTGVQAGAGGTVNVSGVSIYGNGVGFAITAGGTIKSFGNNFNTDGGSTTLPNLNTQ